MDNNLAAKEQLARQALANALVTGQFKESILLFIEHHLEEIEVEYWQEFFGTNKPSAEQIIAKLEVEDRSYLEDEELDEDEIEYYDNHLDFNLPDDVSQYVLCVKFKDGQVHDISMES
ncbi:MAG: DUF2004 domain-containing protein [Acinetobacter sp.]|nr:MAG: DUF2004 domain-containing protein [Acinetobacter sp.]